MDEQEVLAGKHSVLEAPRSGRSINKIWIAEQAQKLTDPAYYRRGQAERSHRSVRR